MTDSKKINPGSNNGKNNNNHAGQHSGGNNNQANDKDIESHLLALIREFIAEIKADRALSPITVDSSLDRDLGIDSLGRVELFLRIEKRFEVSLPESLMAQAETIKDIIKGIKNSNPEKKVFSREFAAALEESRFDPSSANTLTEILLRHAAVDPNRPHIYLMDEKGEEIIIRYGDLLEGARKVAAGLVELGIKKDDTVALMLPTCKEFFFAFFGILFAGGVPVPIYPPVRPDKIEEYALREAGILNNAEVRVLITFSQVEALSRLLRVFIKSLNAVTTVDMLMASKHRVPNVSHTADDAAMIQYTSGSTSAPKGVLLTHANLLANIRSVSKAANITTRDVGVSWLPLYHDMGLIGAWFSTLYMGFPLTLMSPMTFLARPERWLWAIHYHRGTLSAGPNFAYELCIRRIKDEDIIGLDLSSWRLAFNGAEAINPRTLERFTKKFEPYGFKADTFYPVYGLAENSVAVSFPPIRRKPIIDVIQRDAFDKKQKAIPASLEDHNVLEFVCCGVPIPDHDVRIVDDKGQEVAERVVGNLQFTGPSAMRGYYRNPEATQAIYRDGWWDSGDFAYMANGEIYITGRKKDLIIKAGRNLYPQEIEESASQVTGVRRGCSVAFGVNDPKVGTEKLVVVAETAETKPAIRDAIVKEVIDKISLVVGVPPDEVVLVPPRTIPKTSSGKLQRAATKKMYMEGKLIKPGVPFWLQITRLTIKGAFIRSYRFLAKVGRVIYSGYVAALMVLYLPFLWAILLLPKQMAKSTFRMLIKSLLLLSGTRIKINNKQNLLKYEKMVYVSNHASYADSLILFAILPTKVIFIGKRELTSWPLVGKIFKKFDYLTVDRMDFSKNISDIQEIENQVKSGHSILLFPEGTFTYATGLRPFKMGAFKLAADTESPICPISLNGTRTFLRGENPLLSPTKISVTVGEPIVPQSKEWSEVIKLHTLVRAEIAKHCGELSLDLAAAGPQV